MYSVYFAGELFDQKHITGNALLARAIEKLSENQYRCILPQNWEGDVHSTSVAIRNRDIESVIRADVVLFNFDGPDIDSGTAVEFMLAKMVDVPVVILRTDCRNWSHLFGDDWNLMLSSYPRSQNVIWNALVEYNNLKGDVSAMHTILAQKSMEAFEKVMQTPALLKSPEDLLRAYQHVVAMCGGGLEKILTTDVLYEIALQKMRKQRLQEALHVFSEMGAL